MSQPLARRVDAANAYGRFADDGLEYVVTDPRTPRPWVNVIANPRAGLVVSQTGSGFTWVDNSQLAVVTRWEQDLTRDASGRFLWLRDVETGEAWPLAPAPSLPAYDRFECRHGIGSTTFRTALHGVAAEWTLFVDSEATAELWKLRLTNEGGAPRRLELVAFVEWNCGVTPSPRREITKLFLECVRDAGRNAVFARSHMWEVGSARWGHWNTSFPYVSAFACTERVAEAEGDKAAFLGRLGSFAAPAALSGAPWPGLFGLPLRAVLASRPKRTA